MKKFENPAIEVMNLEIMDAITTSGCDTDVYVECPNDFGIG